MINHITSSAINKHTPLYRGRSDTHVDNQVSKPSHETSLTNEASQRVLNDKIIEKLDKVLQKNSAEPVRQLDPADYTPEAVSNRILSYVQEAIDRAGTRNQNRQALLEQAQAGIDQGFKDAENILTSLNALSGVIADNVQKTYDLIQNGLKTVVDKIQGLNSGAAQQLETSSYSGRTYSQSQSIDLEIQTRDGDTLKLSLSRDATTGEYAARVSNPNGDASYAERSFESNDNFSLSVQGNLSDSEISAIQDLLGGMQGVADQFFNGNAEAALEAGMNLGYNSSEIASFSLSLNESQQSSVTKAYQEVSYLGSGTEKFNQEALNNLLKPVHDFMNSFHAMLNKADSSQLFSDPKSNVIEMLDYFAQTNEKFKPQLDSLEAKAGVPFKSVASDLLPQN